MLQYPTITVHLNNHLNKLLSLIDLISSSIQNYHVKIVFIYIFHRLVFVHMKQYSCSNTSDMFDNVHPVISSKWPHSVKTAPRQGSRYVKKADIKCNPGQCFSWFALHLYICRDGDLGFAILQCSLKSYFLAILAIKIIHSGPGLIKKPTQDPIHCIEMPKIVFFTV